jgi:hypothetical protein
MRRSRRWWSALGLAGATLVMATGIAAVSTGRWSFGLAVAPQSCALTVPLTPRTEAGAPWQPHRHALVPAGEIPGGHSFRIRNERRGQTFAWRLAQRAGSGALFFVPTRYAELFNRGWEDDGWVYCLVLGPDPPFRLKKNGFVTAMALDPPKAHPGETIRATITIAPERTTTVAVLVLVSSPDGTTLAQRSIPEQSLSAGTPAEYQLQMYVPPDAAAGVYVVKVGIFRPGERSPLHWNDGTAVFRVVTGDGASAVGR